MAISSIGVGSGLPIEELLKDLRASENQPLVQLQSQQVQAQNRLSAYGTLRGSIEALNTAAKALGKTDTFGALKASTAGDSFTASVSNKAIAGQYNVKVDTLATSQTLVTKGVADRSAAIGSSGGTLSVKINNEVKTLEVSGANGSGPSLNDLVAAINGDASLGFQATLVNDGSGTPHRLLLTSTETGTKASIQSLSFAATDSSTDLQNFIAFDSANPTANSNIAEEVAVNATLTINGIPIESQTNKVEGAIEGVTLNLLKVDATGANLAITRDDSVTAKAINTFVEAYNSLSNTIKSLTSYDVENQKGSALTGDNLARNLQNQARQALNSVTESGSLWDLGITSNATTGLLEVNTDKLNAALKADMGKAEKIFTGENGISSQVNKVADAFISSNGFFKSAEAGINSTIKILDKQYAATSARIDSKMEQYRQQFSQLDVMMSQMNGISSYLTQQLSMLSNIGKEK